MYISVKRSCSLRRLNSFRFLCMCFFYLSQQIILVNIKEIKHYYYITLRHDNYCLSYNKLFITLHCKYVKKCKYKTCYKI